MKALITAGGHGTRLRPITHTQNKHLIPIANKLMLGYALDYAHDVGIEEVGIIINEKDKSIEKAFGKGDSYGLKIAYIEQSAPLGLGHVIKIAEPFIGSDSFVFYLGDNILVGGINKFVDEFQSNGSNCHLVLSKVPDPNRFGVAEVIDGKIIGIEEKPSNPKSNLAVTGIYIYDSHIFEAVNNIKPSARGELEISDAHQYLLENGYAISYSEITGWWKDTGKPSDLLEANRLVLDNIKDNRRGNIDSSSTVSGRVIIGEGAEIVDSNIRGPVVIGDNVKIEGAYVGPYTAVGDGCIIINSEIEYSILMNNCSIYNISRRIEASLLGSDVHLLKSKAKPITHRFILGDQSRVEID